MWLPSYTWNVDPVLTRVPLNFVLYGLGAGAALAAIYGLVKKDREQIWTVVMAGVMALVASSLLKDGLELRYYSLIFLLVFLGGHALLNWQVKRGGGSPEVANDFIVYGVLGVLVGARLGHVIFYDLEHALQDPTWIFQINKGGLASHGAVLGLIFAMWLFTRRRGVPFLEGADRFAFSAALGATLVRVGNLFNSEIVGRVTDQTWGIRFPRFDQGTPNPPLRYPSQIYEILLGIAVLIGLFIADRAMGKERRPRGALISWFFTLYFSGRMYTEFYKEYEAISPDSPLTMGQYLSIPGALLGFYGLYWSYKRRLPAGWDHERFHEDDDDAYDEEALDDDRYAETSSTKDVRAADEKPRRKPKKSRKKAPPSLDPMHDPDVEAEFEGGSLKKRKIADD